MSALKLVADGSLAPDLEASITEALKRIEKEKTLLLLSLAELGVITAREQAHGRLTAQQAAAFLTAFNAIDSDIDCGGACDVAHACGLDVFKLRKFVEGP